jgi:hypothetical protein
MTWVMQDVLLGSVDLTLVDTAGPGPYALVGANAGKMGRYNLPSQFVDATDPILGGGFFTYAQVQTITPQTISSVALQPSFTAQTISSMTISGSTVTVTTGSAHGITTGAIITVAGVTPSSYNGTWVLASGSGTTFTFVIASNTPAGNATIQGTYVAATTYATITTGSAHGLGLGASVQLTGFTPAAWNNYFTAYAVPSTTTLVINTTQVFSQVPPYISTATNALVTNQDSVNTLTNTNPPTTNPTVTGAYVGGIGVGQVVQFIHTQDANGNLILQATPWAGTANSGISLGVAISYPMSGQWAWFQVGGAMIVYAYGVPAAGNQNYFAATGVVQPTAVSSKQCQGTQFSTALGATLGTGSKAVTLPYNQAVMWGTFPLAQGAIT